MGLFGQRFGYLLACAIFVLIVRVAHSQTEEPDKDEGAIMDGWFESGEYDKRVRPNIREGAIQINVSMYVLDFIDVDESKHEYTIQLYLRQSWEDKRLAYAELTDQISSITLNAENSKKLWIPDTFVANERRSKWHDVTVENEFTRVSPDGDVLRSIRLTVTAGCPMDLMYFPFDTNVCSLEIESYGHKLEDYYYTWKHHEEDDPSIGTGPYHSPEMNVLGHRGVEKIVELSTGNYSRLRVEFIFQRRSFRYIRDIYIPAALTTFITFLTLSVGSPPFRLLLSLICFLGMLILSSITSADLPPNSNTTLHCYIGISFSMIFATILVNFLVSHVLKRASNKSGPPSQTRNVYTPPTPTEESPEETKQCFVFAGQPEFSSGFLKNVYVLCDIMKYMLPILYVVFNVWYWIFLMIAVNYVPDEDFVISDENNGYN